MQLIDHLVRDNIRTLKAYSSARSLYQTGILLDANESAFDPFSPPQSQHGLNRYPDGSNRELRERFADYFRLETAQISIGNGSDELIDLLVRIFCRPGVDEILTLPPTFGMYKVAAKMNDVGVCEITGGEGKSLQSHPLPLRLPVEDILAHSARGVKLIFICNPNNPTGASIDPQDILRIVREGQSVVVVDEAYGEFMDGKSMMGYVGQYVNLVVLKTLSKAYAMAGIRMGVAAGSEAIIEWLQKIKLPYNINALSAGVMLGDFNYPALVAENVQKILHNKRQLERALNAIPLIETLFPSEGNFFLVRIHESDQVFTALVEQGIIVRKVDPSHGLENCLRISVGSEKDNARLIAALQTWTPERSVNPTR